MLSLSLWHRWGPQSIAGHGVVSHVCATSVNQRHPSLWAKCEGLRYSYGGEIVGQFEVMPRQNASEHDLQLINRKGRP